MTNTIAIMPATLPFVSLELTNKLARSHVVLEQKCDLGRGRTCNLLIRSQTIEPQDLGGYTFVALFVKVVNLWEAVGGEWAAFEASRVMMVKQEQNMRTGSLPRNP
jgi:hypothetical protein